MRITDTAELYVHATPEQVARAVLPRTATGGLTFTADGSWHTAPWGPTLDAWRREVRWERGRARGRALIDLVPADGERTLVLVTLASDGRRSPGRQVHGSAAVLGRHLRTLAEGGAVAITRDTAGRRGAVAAPAPDRPAAAAVGYSGP